MMIYGFDRAENTGGKRENAGSPFPTMFSRGFFYRGVNPFPNDKFLNSSKLKKFADNNFEFDVNGRKFSSQVKNTVGKGEIARFDQFLLFLQCFQRTCTEDS